MYKILDHINSSQDIKNLRLSQMEYLADDLRKCLLNSVAQCGGHLAANLGVVEITIALHYVFDTRRDRIVWDVGHQSYAHKIISGRRTAMGTLRQYGGISGFPKTEESIEDAFNTGHSSTSISAVLGMAIARDINKEDYETVAVIGDGALTGGMALEALNHAGHIGRDMIVILNDNEMSINKNVGAMSSYLNRLRSGTFYNGMKEEIEHRLSRIPGIGPNLTRAVKDFKDTLRGLIVPGQLFEELGFTYIGPVDGHDIEEMIAVFDNARFMRGPVLIHVLTQKGKGYDPATEQPDIFHGIGPFDLETGLPFKKGVISYTDVFGEALITKAELDSRVVAITAAMTGGTGLSRFAEKYADRFFDVGICEQHAVTLAAGMAKQGMRPVVCLYSAFVQRAYDQIVHDVAMQNLPVIFAVDRAGLVGDDGPTHHGVLDLAFMQIVPNMTVMAPANEDELADMIETAFTLNSPTAIRYPRGAGNNTPVKSAPQILPVGKARIIEEGGDVAILAIGRGVVLAEQAMDLLKSSGVNPSLVNMRFLKPLDADMICQMAEACPRITTVEEGCVTGGLGALVLQVLAARGICAEVEMIGIPDHFVEQGNVDILLDVVGLSPQKIAGSVLKRWPELEKKPLEQITAI